MSLITHYFILIATIAFLTAGAAYEVYRERMEIEQALVQLHEEEVGLREHVRYLTYQIEDLKAVEYSQ